MRGAEPPRRASPRLDRSAESSVAPPSRLLLPLLLGLTATLDHLDDRVVLLPNQRRDLGCVQPGRREDHLRLPRLRAVRADPLFPLGDEQRQNGVEHLSLAERLT